MSVYVFGVFILFLNKINLMGSDNAIEKFVIEAVKKKRLENNISQAQLARLLGVSEGFIGNIENQAYRDKYNLRHLNELAKIFKCSPREFLPDKPLLQI